MASITKDSFDETQNYGKVVFQKGRDVTDFELNELQDNIRAPIAREAFDLRMDGAFGQLDLQALGSGALNDVLIGAGSVLIGTQKYTLVLNTLLSALGVTLVTNSSGTHIYEYIYLAVTESEIDAVADPNIAVSALGETARRRQLTVTWNVGSSVPTTVDPAQAGGTTYVPIARLFREDTVASIGTDDVLDLRPMPGPDRSELLANIILDLTNDGFVEWIPTSSTLNIRDINSIGDVTQGLRVGVPRSADAIVHGSFTLANGECLAYRPKWRTFAIAGDLNVPGVAVAVAPDGRQDEELTVEDWDSIPPGASLLVIARRDGNDVILHGGRRLIGALTLTTLVDSWTGRKAFESGLLNYDSDPLTPSLRERITHIPLFGGEVGSVNTWTGLEIGTSPSNTYVRLSNGNIAKHIWSFETRLPDGSQLKEIRAQVIPGIASRATGSRLKIEVHESVISWTTAGVPTGTRRGFDESNGLAAWQFLVITGMLETVTNNLATTTSAAKLLHLVLTSGDDGGGHNADQVSAIQLVWNDAPGPRNS